MKFIIIILFMLQEFGICLSFWIIIKIVSLTTVSKEGESPGLT